MPKDLAVCQMKQWPSQMKDHVMLLTTILHAKSTKDGRHTDTLRPHQSDVMFHGTEWIRFFKDEGKCSHHIIECSFVSVNLTRTTFAAIASVSPLILHKEVHTNHYK